MYMSLKNSELSFEEATKDWSPARIKAYKSIDDNPNSYYYRFNAPGETQSKGNWNAHEVSILIYMYMYIYIYVYVYIYKSV